MMAKWRPVGRMQPAKTYFACEQKLATWQKKTLTFQLNNSFLIKYYIVRLPDVPGARGQSPNSYFCPRLKSVPKMSLDFNQFPHYVLFLLLLFLFHFLKSCNTA